MADREHEYELLSHGSETESLGKVWWDGKKIQTDEKSLEWMLKSRPIIVDGKDVHWQDGIKFLEGLPRYYRSYISARKV